MGKLREVLEHPDELIPLVQMAFAAKRAKVLPKDKSLAFCYDMLNRVSRRCFYIADALSVPSESFCIMTLIKSFLPYLLSPLLSCSQFRRGHSESPHRAARRSVSLLSGAESTGHSGG